MIKRLLWKYLVRRTARAHGFLDPIRLFSRLSQFAQPSEVLAPTELLRATAVLHARGLLNAQVIQHNLDWIWPFWINKQFDPRCSSFIPRSFSLTHINLTHRNWTAVGLPDSEETPLVDPRGLVTPLWDGWSLDAWIVNKDGKDLIPSQSEETKQYFDLESNSIITQTSLDDMSLTIKVDMLKESGMPVCRMQIFAQGKKSSNLVVSVRPYNPEGVSLIKNIAPLEHKPGFQINNNQNIWLESKPQNYIFSDFHRGDVYHYLHKQNAQHCAHCPVEMSSAAALFLLGAEKEKHVIVTIPLGEKNKNSVKPSSRTTNWAECLKDACRATIPDDQWQFLFDASLRTVLLHIANDVYAGPYTYKRFWFRDAVFIAHALLCCGLSERVEHIIDQFEKRQKISGYFESQEGEWDSNGQVLWLIQKYCQMTNRKPKAEWKNMIHKGTRWIIGKRLSDDSNAPHAGLMPPGFSAEHFGPNNYYYWDNFWSLAGLKAATYLFQHYGDEKFTEKLFKEINKFSRSIEQSLEKTERTIGRVAMPSSPYRRLDSAAVGSLAAGYPLALWPSQHKRLLNTADYLFHDCCVHNGFFHDMSHSGINPYLTLHIAQVFLRASDPRYRTLVQGIADLASPTGQWPEAIHPITKGGCMGDGQHTWAAAEWLMMMRNCFVREEESSGKLILCSGILSEWLRQSNEISFGPTSTIYGAISLRVKKKEKQVHVQWDVQWHAAIPHIEISFPGMKTVSVSGKDREVLIDII